VPQEGSHPHEALPLNIHIALRCNFVEYYYKKLSKGLLKGLVDRESIRLLLLLAHLLPLMCLERRHLASVMLCWHKDNLGARALRHSCHCLEVTDLHGSRGVLINMEPKKKRFWLDPM